MADATREIERDYLRNLYDTFADVDRASRREIFAALLATGVYIYLAYLGAAREAILIEMPGVKLHLTVWRALVTAPLIYGFLIFAIGVNTALTISLEGQIKAIYQRLGLPADYFTMLGFDVITKRRTVYSLALYRRSGTWGDALERGVLFRLHHWFFAAQLAASFLILAHYSDSAGRMAFLILYCAVFGIISGIGIKHAKRRFGPAAAKENRGDQT